MKRKIAEKRLDKDEVINEIFDVSIFNSLPSFFLCLILIAAYFFASEHIPSYIENKERLLNLYGYVILTMKGIICLSFVVFIHSLLKNFLSFAVFTNKRVIFYKGIFFTRISEMEFLAYGGNDIKRSILSRILFYAKFSIYGYGMQVIEIPALHKYKAFLSRLHEIRSI